MERVQYLQTMLHLQDICLQMETTLETSEEDVDKTTLETSEENVDKATLETSEDDFY